MNHKGKCVKCGKEEIFDSSAKRCIPKINPKKSENAGGAISGGAGPKAAKKGRRVGKDKSLNKKDQDDAQDFLYGGFDVVSNSTPVPVMIEIVVTQKIRRLKKSKKIRR